MENIKLTKTEINKLNPPEKGYIDIKDKVERYLRLRISKSGAKTFYFVRKYKGKPVYKSLGRYPDITPEQAREKCNNENTRLINGEPRDKPEKMLFGELFNRYIEEHGKRFKKTWKEDQRLHDTLFKQWDKTPITSISRNDANTLHEKITASNGAYIANKSIAIIRKVYNFAIDNLELDIRNPAARVKHNKEQSRDRFLNGEELKRLFEALNSEQTETHWKDFFLLLLWTGARRGNVQAMQWQHLDLENGIWKIPGNEFKNGEPFTCILTQPALDILKARQQFRDPEKPYVFPSSSKSGHIQEPKKAWKSVIDRAGLEDVRLHDLRRTLGSWQAATGASLQVIGKTLGHKSQQATAVYSRLDLTPVKRSMDTATTAMLEAVNGNEK